VVLTGIVASLLSPRPAASDKKGGGGVTH